MFVYALVLVNCKEEVLSKKIIVFGCWYSSTINLCEIEKSSLIAIEGSCLSTWMCKQLLNSVLYKYLVKGYPSYAYIYNLPCYREYNRGKCENGFRLTWFPYCITFKSLVSAAIVFPIRTITNELKPLITINENERLKGHKQCTAVKNVNRILPHRQEI